jgi:hypothetical protein
MMDVLGINWMTFLIQIMGLAAWICLAAVIYALVEYVIERRMAAPGRTRPSDREADDIKRL